MATPRRWKTTDIEAEVGSYQRNMSPLAKELARLSDKAVDAIMRDILAMMDRGQYNPASSLIFLNGMADLSTVKRMEELAKAAPDRYAKRIWESVVGQLASGKLTRRRAITAIAKLNCYAVLGDIHKTAARILTTVAEDGFYRGTFILQKSLGRAWEVDGLSGARLTTLVNAAYSMQDAKKFMDPLVDMSKDAATYSMLQGLPPERVAESVEDVKKSTPHRAKREARTVITATASDAHREAYERHGVKHYIFVCTYDERTCPKCGELDRMEFAVEDACEGVNYPPIHPNCRCTTVAALSREIEELMAPREIMDTATGEFHVIPQSYTYAQWYDEFGPGRKDGLEYVPKGARRRGK